MSSFCNSSSNSWRMLCSWPYVTCHQPALAVPRYAPWPPFEPLTYIRLSLLVSSIRKLKLNVCGEETISLESRSQMNNRIAYLVLFMCIVVGVVVIYQSRVVTDRMIRTAMLQHVPEVSACQPLSTSEFDSRPTGTPCATGRPCTYPDVVDLRVIAITFNRAESLSKLLRSLDPLVLDRDRGALEIWIDRGRNNGVDKRTMEVASEFSWKGGLTRVHVQVALYFLLLDCLNTHKTRLKHGGKTQLNFI